MNRETRMHVRAAEDLLDSRLSFHRKNLRTALCREIVTLGEAALKAITALKSDLITAEEKIAGIARVLAIGARAAGVDTDPDPQACPTCLQMADDYKGSHEAGWTFTCPSGHEWSDTREGEPEPEPATDRKVMRCPAELSPPLAHLATFQCDLSAGHVGKHATFCSPGENGLTWSEPEPEPEPELELEPVGIPYEYLPCPFCGALVTHRERLSLVEINCSGCDITLTFLNESQANEIWNSRPVFGTLAL